MGMFDTIVFQKPIVCKCGHKIESSQVKVFECAMDTYRVGDMIPSSPIFALEREFEYCEQCSATIEFFVACSYGIYLGVFVSYVEAKSSIDTFGMKELLKFYAHRVPPRQGLIDESPERFMERLVEYYDSPTPSKEGKFSALWRVYDFEEKRPLEAIKNYLKQYELARAIKRIYNEKLEFDISYTIVDSNSAKVYNEKIQTVLNRDVLFEVRKITNQQESVSLEDHIVVSYKDLNENTIRDCIQYWLDQNRISLEVVIVQKPSISEEV